MMPSALAKAIEGMVRDIDPRQLAADAQALSQRYRAGLPGADRRSLTRTMALAYAAARLPATYGALQRVFQQFTAIRPGLAPQTLLDIGAGPGTAMWAAIAAFPSISEFTAVEAEPEMVRLGQDLAAYSEDEPLRQAHWNLADASLMGPGSYDLVVAGYSLGEMDPIDRARLIPVLWRAARTALILVEPGTPPGFARIREFRTTLIALAAHIVAPCPHDEVCPLEEADWCHFAVRVPRTRRQRLLKSGTAAYEDEKFSYVIAAAANPPERWSRVIRHPQVWPGRIELQLCGEQGLSQQTVFRSEGEPFRRARKIRWGDAWDSSSPR